jgi:hypothetical protein
MKRALLFIASLAASPAWAAALIDMSVTLPKEEWRMGSSLPARLKITNHSPHPIVLKGWLPYQVSLADSAGRSVYNPRVEIDVVSAAYVPTTINAGEAKEFPLDLANYADFEHAGRYRAEVKIDPTEVTDWPNYPSAHCELQMGMPSPMEAELMVAHAGNGEYQRFTRSVFLGPLKSVALGGEPQAADAIGRIPTAAATQALIELLGCPQFDVAIRARFRLALRLPAVRRKPPISLVMTMGSGQRLQAHLLDQAPTEMWDSSSRTAVVNRSRQLLDGPDPTLRFAAMQFLASFGDASDSSRLMALLRSDLGTAPKESPEGVTYALLTLRDRGIVRFGSPQTDLAWAYLYFEDLEGSPHHRPQGWGKLINQWAVDSHPQLKWAAICSIPRPPPDEWIPLLQKLTGDPDDQVRTSANFFLDQAHLARINAEGLKPDSGADQGAPRP